jgi:transcriptional regulator with XRE-family HTH domain
MNEVSYVEIGSVLRNARGERNLSLEQAARELHIRSRYLEALEEGRFSELPGAAYVKGYLQRYAAYLQLDKEEVLRRFEQMDGVLARKAFYFPQVFSREQKPSHHMTYGGLAAALMVYLLWTGLVSDRKDISTVDMARGPSEKASVSAPMAADASCFKAQAILYPPCTNRAERYDLLPLKRQMVSVMELANRDYEPGNL